jgi:hypothetical protein
MHRFSDKMAKHRAAGARGAGLHCVFSFFSISSFYYSFLFFSLPFLFPFPFSCFFLIYCFFLFNYVIFSIRLFISYFFNIFSW